jgi:hypothetical protein
MRGALCAAPSHELFDRVQPWTNLIVDSAVCSISNPDCVLSFIVKNPCCEWCHEQTHGGSKWRVMSPACSLVAAPGYSSVEQGSRLCDRRGCAASVLGARVRANTKQLTTTPVTPDPVGCGWALLDNEQPLSEQNFGIVLDKCRLSGAATVVVPLAAQSKPKAPAGCHCVKSKCATPKCACFRAKVQCGPWCHTKGTKENRMAGSEGCCRYCGMANETEPAGPEDDDDDIDKEDEVESDEAAMSEEECDLVSDGDSSCDDAN